MSEKEIKRLKRLKKRKLLEILSEQARRIEALETELCDARRRLEDNRVLALDAGSIAEAALRVNGVFDAADSAARQYIDNIKLCSERCDKMIADTKYRCLETEKRMREKVFLLKAELDRLQTEMNV